MSRQDRFSWFAARLRRSETSRPGTNRRHSSRIGSPYARRLHLETLEDRRMLAGVTVGNALDVVNAPDVSSIAMLIADDGGDGISLREAVTAANNTAGADTILFAAALSGGTITLGGTELAITEAVTIDATSLAANVTIDANLLSRIFNITATTGDFTLAGLTLTGGQTTAFAGGGGGAIRSLTSGTLAIEGSTVSGNNTLGDFAHGGGIHARGDLTLTNSTISGNSVSGDSADGGGIYVNGDVTLANSTVSGNSTNADVGEGGGIRAFGNVTLTNSTVSGNYTTADASEGGGIIASGNVTLTDSTVSGNYTLGINGFGAGIYAFGDVVLTNSTVSGNYTLGANGYGGGIVGLSNVTLTNSTVSGNSTSGSTAFGAGIAVGGDVTLTYSTVTDNRANHATSTGGGIWSNDSGTDAITITNSILADNTAGGGSPDIRLGTSTLDVDYSLIGDNAGTSLVEAPVGSPDTDGNLIGGAVNGIIDPLLGSLTNNGGPTETHALLVGSPAIDAGDPAPAAPPANDQRGAPFVRIADGGINGVRIDIGAFEVPDTLVVDNLIDESDGDFSAGDLSLREAIEQANAFPAVHTINFAGSLSGQTIMLTLGELAITDDLTIDATSLAQNVTIDANNASRIFNITVTNGNFAFNGLTLTGGQTTGNDAFQETTNNGGAIRSLTTGTLTLEGSTISGNSTLGTFAYGGGIYADGDVMLTGSVVSGNSTSANYAAGGGIAVDGNVTLTNSTISGNSTSGNLASGGGIAVDNGNVTLTNSTVSGNSTSGYTAGGGIFADGDVTLTYSTVTDNRATYATSIGGGIWTDNKPIVITGSIVADNTAGGGNPDLEPGTGTLTVDFSLIGDNAGTALIEAQVPDANGNLIGSAAGSGVIDPLLGILADNGGPTETHALLAGSPAIDAGDPSIVFNPAEFDQRGAPFVRVVAGRIDIGAFEAIAPSADFDSSGFVTGLDFLAWQRGFGTPAPTAVKTDGDADNDGDVDGVDLGFWESQFGGPAPLLALSTAIEVVGSGQQAVGSEQLSAFSLKQVAPTLSAAELIDAAMAWELASEVSLEEEPLLDSRSTASAAAQDAFFAADDIAPGLLAADEVDLPATNSRAADVAEDPWLTEELLEQVFG